MSSKKWIWAVVVIGIILLALWYSGVFNSVVAPASTQPAAAVTATNTNAMTAQDAGIKADIATLDMQIAAINTAMTVSGTPSKTQVGSVSASFKVLSATFTKVVLDLKVRATNSQTAGTSLAGVTAAFSDLNAQLSNMSSQVGAASKNAMATSSSATTITASFKQLQTAQGYVQAARADIQTIVTTLGVK